MRRPALALVMLLVTLLVGCTKSKVDIVPVRGRVTYGGGDWPAAGTIYFQPKTAAAGLPLLAAVASFGTDGKFAAKTAQRTGLVPGIYTVRIECWEEAPKMSAPNSGKSWVDKQYEHGPTADYEINVPADSSGLDLNFDIPKCP